LTEATGAGARPTGAGTRPTGVGASLREAREAQGLAIDDVAQQLKFAPRQIESLENERFDRLPGPTIARGMVRNYARLLKLDPEPLIQRMGPQAESVPDPAHIAERLRQEITISDGAKRSTLIYAGFSIGLLVLVGALAYEWRQQTALPEFVVPARERPQQEQPPQSAAATEPAQTAAAKQVPAPVSEPPAVEQKKPETVVAAAVETPLAPGMHRIVLRTEAEAWLEVKDGAGRMLISSLTPAGIERTVRGRAPFEIVIGNASFVKLTYDGTPVDLRPHIKVEVARLTLK
jgi:cytoskeleton protein RodZ